MKSEKIDPEIAKEELRAAITVDRVDQLYVVDRARQKLARAIFALNCLSVDTADHKRFADVRSDLRHVRDLVDQIEIDIIDFRDSLETNLKAILVSEKSKS
jgi:hypothetical protein